jgi:hypothetical protein
MQGDGGEVNLFGGSVTRETDLLRGGTGSRVPLLTVTVRKPFLNRARQQAAMFLGNMGADENTGTCACTFYGAALRIRDPLISATWSAS